MEMAELVRKKKHLIIKLIGARQTEIASQIKAIAKLLAEVEGKIADCLIESEELAEAVTSLHGQAAYLLEAGEILGSIKIYKKSLSYCKSESLLRWVKDRIMSIEVTYKML